MGPWHRGVISWINVLHLLPGDVSDFKEILGTQFFHNLLREICGEAGNLDFSTPQNRTIVQFLKREYPKFEVDVKALEYDEKELVLVLSLLLFHSVIKGSDVTRVKMCSVFEEETQVVVKIFVEKLIPLSDVLTKGDVVWAIQEAENGCSNGESPTCFSTTPKSRKTLQIFLQSPISQQQKIINEKCQEIQRLKLKLDSEKSEKNYLLEELAQADDKLKHMSDKYKETVKEMKKLKSGMLQEVEEQQDMALQGPNVAKEQKYNSVIGKLKNKIEELEEGTYTLNQHNEELRKQVKGQSEKIVDLKSKLEDCFRECDRLGEELVVKKEQLDIVTERCQDLEKFLEETKASDADPRHNLSIQSFTGEVEDLGRSVTDLKLCEEKEKNRALTEKVEELMHTLGDLESVKAQNSALQEQLSSTMEKLRNEKNDLEDLHYKQMSQMTSRMEDVKQALEQQLQESWQQIETLRIEKEEEAEIMKEVSSRIEALQLQKENLEETLLQEQIHMNEKNDKLIELSSTIEELMDKKVKLEGRLLEKQHVEILLKEKEEEADKAKFALHDLWQVLSQGAVTLIEEEFTLQEPTGLEDAVLLTTQMVEKFEAEKLKISSMNKALQVERMSLEESLLEEQKRMNEKNNKLNELSAVIKELEDQKVKLEEQLFKERGHVEILLKEKQEEADKVKFALCDLWQRAVPLVEGEASSQEAAAPADAVQFATKLLEKFEAEKQKLSSMNEALQVDRMSLEESLLDEQKRLNEKNNKLKELSSVIKELDDQKIKLEEQLFKEQGHVEILLKEKQEEADKVKFALHDLWQVLSQGAITLIEEEFILQEPTGPEDAVLLTTRMVEKLDAEKQKVSSRHEALQVDRLSLEESLLAEQKRMNEKNNKLNELSSVIKELDDQKIKLEEQLFKEQGHVEILLKEKQEEADKVKFALHDLWQVLSQGAVTLIEEEFILQEPTGPEDAVLLTTLMVEKLEAEKQKVSSRHEALQVDRLSLEESLLAEQKHMNEKNNKLNELSSVIKELDDQKIKLEEQLFKEQGHVEILLKEKQEEADKVKSALHDLWQVLSQGAVTLIEEEFILQEPTGPEDAVLLTTRMVEKLEAEKQKVSSRHEALQVERLSLEESLLAEQKRMNEKNNKLNELSSVIKELEDQKVKLEEQLFKEQGHVEMLLKEKQEEADKVKFALCDLWQRAVPLVEGEASSQEAAAPADAVQFATKLLEKFEAEKQKLSSMNEALQVDRMSLEESLLEEQKRMNEKNNKLKELSSVIKELDEQKIKLEEQLFKEQGHVEILLKEKQEEADKVKFALCDLWQRAVQLVEGEASSQEAVAPEDAVQFVTKLVEKFEAEKLKISSRYEALQVQAVSLEESLLEEHKRMNENNNKMKELYSTIKEMEDHKVKLEERLYQEQCCVEILKKENAEEADRTKSALCNLWQRAVQLVEGEASSQEAAAPEDAVQFVTKLVEIFEAERLKISSRYDALQVEKVSLEESLLEEQNRLNESNNKMKDLYSTIKEMEDHKVKLEEGLYQEQCRVQILMKEKLEEADRIKFALCDLWHCVIPLLEGEVEPQEPAGCEDAVQIVTKLVEKFDDEKLKVSSRIETLLGQMATLDETLLQEQKSLNEKNEKLKELSSAIKELEDQKVKLEGLLFQEQRHVEIILKEKQEESDKVKFALCDLWQHAIPLVEGEASLQEAVAPEDAVQFVAKLLEKFEAEKQKLSSKNEALQVERMSLEESLLEEQKLLNEKSDKLVELSSIIQELEDQKLKLEGLLLQEQAHVQILLKEKQEEADNVKVALCDLWQRAVPLVEGEASSQEAVAPEDAVQFVTKLVEKFEAEKLKISSRYKALQVEKVSLEESLLEEQNRLNENNNKMKELCSTIKEMEDHKVKLEEGLYQEQCRVQILMKEKLEEADRIKFALCDLWQRVFPHVDGEIEPQVAASPEDVFQLITKLLEKFEAEKLKQSSRNETLKMQKAILEETLLEEQKRLIEKNDILKKLSSTIEELKNQKMKLEEGLFQEQRRVEIVMKEKQDEEDRVKFALRDLWQGIGPLVEGNVSLQELAGTEDPVQLVTKLVDYLQKSVITRTAECYSLEEKCKNFCELLDTKTETDKILSEVLAALESSFNKRLVALGNRRATPEGAWFSLSLEALGCCLAAVAGCGGKGAADLREVLHKVRVMAERSDAHEWAATETEKLRERFKAEYSNVRKQLEAREMQLNEARATFKSMREKMEAELLRRIEVVKEEYKGKLDSLKATMKEAYNAEVAKLKVSGESEAQLKAFAEELKAKYRQLALEKQEVQEELLRVKGRAECLDFVSDVAAATGSGDVLDQTFTYVSRRRRSVRTSGMGRMFHEEDEQGEEFNNTYLADMKAGVCLPDDRLGELRFRNSLCPPHLKSSYPAETQFHDPSHVKDEDIMMGFPDDQARRKDRGYRKPGPPTPGKKGRSVVGDETATPRRALKEANDVSGRTTPSRVKALFGLGRASRRDENVPTPRTKALGLFRKPHKRP